MEEWAKVAGCWREDRRECRQEHVIRPLPTTTTTFDDKYFSVVPASRPWAKRRQTHELGRLARRGPQRTVFPIGDLSGCGQQQNIKNDLGEGGGSPAMQPCEKIHLPKKHLFCRNHVACLPFSCFAWARTADFSAGFLLEVRAAGHLPFP